MAENDIYNSKSKYERFFQNLDELIIEPDIKYKNKRGERHYYCINPVNLQYFKQLKNIFDSKDISYVRRLRLINNLKLIVSATDKDLKLCDRTDINSIMAFMHTRCKSPKTKADFVRDIKHFWRILFPDMDERGRPDETITPYVVRHLEAKMDKSKEKSREDKLDTLEFTSLVSYFSRDKRIQAYLTLALESLARPQELLYLRIKDFEIKDGYAKVWVSSHGKEGTKLIQCSDSFPYVLAWYNEHPYKDKKDTYFFINLGDKDRINQLTPANINKKLRLACKDLKINKPISCYSLKRAGVTFDLLAGKQPQTIQHKAGWTSLKQMDTYSQMNQEDNYFIELCKQGKIKDPEILKRYQGFINGSEIRSSKICLCGQVVGFEEKVCSKCNRPLDHKERIKAEIEKNTVLQDEVTLIKLALQYVLDKLGAGKFEDLTKHLPELK